MDAARRAYERVMNKLPRPLILERQEREGENIPGGCLLGLHLKRFMSLDSREKLLVIRTWLEEMYGDEYSRAGIDRKHIISYQGLKNIEEMLKEGIHESSIVRLAEAYNVPVSVIKAVEPEGEWQKGLYIGKEEDKQEYFYSFYLLNGKNHTLDDTDYSQVYWDDEIEEMEEVEVEVIMKVVHPDNGLPLSTKQIARVKVLSTDASRLHDIIAKDMDMVAHKHNEYMSMHEYVKELQQRLTAAEHRNGGGGNNNVKIKEDLNELLANGLPSDEPDSN